MDLQEVFDAFWAHWMKLNPAKYAFEILRDKFLGYMISQCVIEVNLERIWAIIEMKPPRTLRKYKA